MSDLRRAVLRLAAESPEMRADLMVLLGMRIADQRRMFEYSDRDGNIFWSFSRLADIAVRKIRLSDHQGTHFRTHISQVHSLALQRFEDW